MTREEEIQHMAGSISDVMIAHYIPHSECKGYYEGYIDGAQWADNNPKSPWISVKDDLPCNHEDLMENEYYTKKVLAILEWNENPSKKHIEVCDMCNKLGSFDIEFYWREIGYYTVTHWMRLPKLPKEE